MHLFENIKDSGPQVWKFWGHRPFGAPTWLGGTCPLMSVPLGEWLKIIGGSYDPTDVRPCPRLTKNSDIIMDGINQLFS